MSDNTLENQLAMDLAAISDLSSAAVRDILICPWDVFRALTRYVQRIEAALYAQQCAYSLDGHDEQLEKGGF